MVTEEDLRHMRRAIALADRGGGFVHPNPLVGAVVVKEGRVIGEGWHERYGEAHAERNALAACGEDPRGATLHVTLEPCCHHGKTPPCTDAIIAAGIARVVVALEDPNPLVAGKGIERLRQAGIAVETGVRASEAREQNRVFLKYITTRRPWVTLKTAMTLDGKIATRAGDSRWITGEAAREMVHEARSRHMAVVAGIGTVLADDPLLNARLPGREARQPARVIVDSRARLPLESRIVQTARLYATLLMHAPDAPGERLEALRAAGVVCRTCAGMDGRVDVTDLCRQLGEAGIDSLLLEGGSELNHSFLSARQVDEVLAFIAPKIVGGAGAKSPVGGAGVERMRDALELVDVQVSRVGEDILIKGKIDVHGNH
ncbi:MAG: bifunctional diaminohydroxyphosphoribosylaminopyrimidine deaminase/5-amino-6-(5-phosphoribosylamino)uracil reductase RibD [Odoribacteraceae bacterium]|nr:bifunctional diaminohydroxyphosphoribosylaminopyrimidine deaminase/5-amino-6-(5-phosphoribosylamino)uracil reductase RibD [Odoribacteraceae bacterium]